MLGMRKYARSHIAVRFVALGLAAATAASAPWPASAAPHSSYVVQASPNPLGLVVRARRQTIRDDQYVSIFASLNSSALNNPQDAQRDVNLERWDQGTRNWRVVVAYQVDQGMPNSLATQSLTLDRNTLFRLHALGAADPVQPDTYSRTIVVDVLPKVRFTALRDGAGHVTYLYDAQVHALRHPRLEDVYLYRRRASRQRYVRFAALKLHYYADDLSAEKRVYDPKRAQLLACVPHQLVPDMGLRFFDPTCGRRTLPPSSESR
jgi:hypothetical protein